MRPFSSRLFRDAVRHFTVIENTSGASGVPSYSWPGGGTDLLCRAEPATGSSTNARRSIHPDALESATGWTLAFRDDPGCDLNDKFVLIANGRNLIALGPARRDASGDAVLFLVDCDERS
jgi:hypothetical protein